MYFRQFLHILTLCFCFNAIISFYFLSFTHHWIHPNKSTYFYERAWNCTSILWRMFGESEELSAKAGYFASVTSFSIPAQVIFSQLSQYFFAQRITRPEVISSICALTFNLIFGLIFVLGFPIPEFSGFGFFACPIVTTMVEYVNVFVFVAIVYTFHKHLLYEWDWKEITKERVLIYTKLYVPAAFSVASDFWRMAFIGFVAAKLGDLEVAVFNTSYRIMWITLTFIGATSGASGIKMGLRLGSGDHNGAKQAGEICVAISVIVLAILSSLLLWDIRSFGEIFSSDQSFLDLLEESKVPFVATLTFMNLACAVEKIPISMGRTADVFWMGFIGSWLGKYFTKFSYFRLNFEYHVSSVCGNYFDCCITFRTSPRGSYSH